MEIDYNAQWALLATEIDNCPFCREEGNPLQHILGGGKKENPEFFFVLINPTYRNISSNQDWEGQRIPYVGCSSLWRVLVKAGFLEKNILFITERKVWDTNDVRLVEGALKGRRTYITNLVKCAAYDAKMPGKERIDWGLGILKKEIGIINPRLVITFGALPFQALTGKSIRLSQHYQEVRQGKVDFARVKVEGKLYSVFPTYFPTGRGNPRRCVEILKKLKRKRYNT